MDIQGGPHGLTFADVGDRIVGLEINAVWWDPDTPADADDYSDFDASAFEHGLGFVDVEPDPLRSLEPNVND